MQAKPGDKITVLVNMDDGTLAFLIGGKLTKVVENDEGLKDGIWYPTFGVWKKDDGL